MTFFETLMAASLSGLVAATGVGLLKTQTQVAHQTTARSERNDGTRAAALILQTELDMIEPGADLRAIARDSISARIFRGVGVVCGVRDSIVYMRFRGMRMPEPGRDSAMQLAVENAVAVKLVAEQSVCRGQPGERLLAMSLSQTARLGSTWMFFENGTYQLHSNALRYRRDKENRQPVTAEIVDVKRSEFLVRADTVVRSIVVRLRERGGPAEFHASLRFRNAP
jgi:hypothetical protein